MTLVFGTDYSAVTVPFGLLCVYIMFLTQGNILASVFFGIGQPGKHRAFVGLRALILVILIYPCIKLFGLTGAAGVVLLASFVAMCIQTTAIHKTIGLNILDYVKSWIPGLALATPVSAVIVVVRFLKPDSPMVHLLVGFLSWIVVCGLGLLLPKFFNRRQWQVSTSS